MKKTNFVTTKNLENKFVTLILLAVVALIGFSSKVSQISSQSNSSGPKETVTIIVDVGPLGGRTTHTEFLPIETNTVYETNTVTSTQTARALPSAIDTQADYAAFTKYLQLSDHTIVWLVFVRWAYDNNLWPVPYTSGQTQLANCQAAAQPNVRPWDKATSQLRFLVQYCKALGVEFY